MEELLIRAKKGDPDALEKLVTDYKGLVRSISNKFYLVGGDKDDLLQEGMLGFIYAVKKYDEDKGAFPSFAKLCVTRQILNAVRRSNNVKQKALCDYVDLDDIATLADPSDNPLENLLQKEVSERISQAINEKLTHAERQVIFLFVDGNSYEDIARTLNRSVKSVDGALQRARIKLMKYVN